MSCLGDGFSYFCPVWKEKAYPPPVFLQESVELLENKGVGAFGNDKEFATV
jgi:hypothetical protein